jgi:hypothetical protein
MAFDDRPDATELGQSSARVIRPARFREEWREIHDQHPPLSRLGSLQRSGRRRRPARPRAESIRRELARHADDLRRRTMRGKQDEKSLHASTAQWSEQVDQAGDHGR